MPEPPRLIAPRTEQQRLPVPPAPRNPAAGAAAEAIGAAAQQIGKTAHAEYMVELNRQRRARLDEFAATVSEKKRQLLLGDDQNPGALHLTGKDALGIASEESPYIRDFDGWGEKTLASITDPVVKERARDIFRRQREDAVTRLRDHEWRQADAYAKTTARFLADAVEDDARVAYRDDQQWESLVFGSGRAAILRQVRGFTGRDEQEAIDNLTFLEEHAHIPWVRRLLEPDGKRLDNGDGTWSTHSMAAEVTEEGHWIVFPTVVEDPRTGELVRLPQEPGRPEAMRYALQNGTYIDFGDDKEAALRFAENGYKKGTWLDQGDDLEPRDEIERAAVEAWVSGNVRVRIMQFLGNDDVDGARATYEKYKQYLIDRGKQLDRSTVEHALKSATDMRQAYMHRDAIVDIYEKSGYDPGVIEEELRKIEDPNLRKMVTQLVREGVALADDEHRAALRRRSQYWYELLESNGWQISKAVPPAKFAAMTPEEQDAFFDAVARHERFMQAEAATSSKNPASADPMRNVREDLQRKYGLWLIGDTETRKKLWWTFGELAEMPPDIAQKIAKWQRDELDAVRHEDISRNDTQAIAAARKYGIIKSTDPARWTDTQYRKMASFLTSVDRMIEDRQRKLRRELTPAEIDDVINEAASATVTVVREGFGWETRDDLHIWFLSGESDVRGIVDVGRLSPVQHEAFRMAANSLGLDVPPGGSDDYGERAGQIFAEVLKAQAEGRVNLEVYMGLARAAVKQRELFDLADSRAGANYRLPDEAKKELWERFTKAWWRLSKPEREAKINAFIDARKVPIGKAAPEKPVAVGKTMTLRQLPNAIRHDMVRPADEKIRPALRAMYEAALKHWPEGTGERMARMQLQMAHIPNAISLRTRVDLLMEAALKIPTLVGRDHIMALLTMIQRGDVRAIDAEAKLLQARLELVLSDPAKYLQETEAEAQKILDEYSGARQ